MNAPVRLVRPRRVSQVILGATLALTVSCSASTGGAHLTRGLASLGPVAPPLVAAGHRVGVGVHTDAAGVNAGTAVQARGITMRPIPRALASAAADASGALGVYGPHGGCTPGYGRGLACLPPVSPAAAAMRMSALEMPWTCADVRTLMPAGIALDRLGLDPLHLDRNGDGTACSPGD